MCVCARARAHRVYRRYYAVVTVVYTERNIACVILMRCPFVCLWCLEGLIKLLEFLTRIIKMCTISHTVGPYWLRKAFTIVVLYQLNI